MNAFQSILSAQVAAEEAAYKAWDKGYLSYEEWRQKLDSIQLHYVEALHNESTRNSRLTKEQEVALTIQEYNTPVEVDVDNIDF